MIERDLPEPGRGQVRIAVRAADVNPSDVGMRQRGVNGVPAPWTPGWDFAGVDPTTGAEVMGVVLPWRPEGGAQAEQVVVPAASVVPIPDGASLEQAATLPMNGLTAKLGLELLGLPEGATLLVTGGAGQLASYVIPLAKRAGLRVLADAKDADAELVRSFGADEVLPRGEPYPEGVADGVYDTALRGREAFPAIRPGGGLAFVRGWDGDDVEDGVTIHRVQVWTVLERTDWLEELRELAAQGVLAMRVAETFPPERAADAHRLMDAGGLRGRAVIVFDAT
jgi:NADPH:quinone reductase-like Zn-dependent oxidoreductase